MHLLDFSALAENLSLEQAMRKPAVSGANGGNCRRAASRWAEEFG